MTHHLLFVDDIPEDAEIACWHLIRAGICAVYRVVCSEDGARGALEELLPALILCDIVLPQWDCWSALRLCRQLAPATPFGIHSGAVSIEDRNLARERGSIGCAEKDMPAELIALARLALRLP